MATKDHDTVHYQGKIYTLTQDAYVDNYGTDSAVRYYAHAANEAGDEYLVAWDTTEQWDLATEEAQLEAESNLSDDKARRLAKLQAMALTDVNDESNACDWANPIKVTLL